MDAMYNDRQGTLKVVHKEKDIAQALSPYDLFEMFSYCQYI